RAPVGLTLPAPRPASLTRPRLAPQRELAIAKTSPFPPPRHLPKARRAGVDGLQGRRSGLVSG
ncbi:MAG: hypothetical protein ABR924_16720, partial [Terracidiphilus sp.]